MTFPFTRDRFVHRLLERAGDVCLVERLNQITDSVHWEVVMLRHEPARRGPRGTTLPAGERYPAAQDWGTYGWTFTSIEDARRKYAVLVARRAEKGGSDTA